MTAGESWTTATDGGFGRIRPADEYYHGTGPAEPSLSETWFWGFHIPEHGINCFAYCWAHPTLGVASGGLIVQRGITPHHLAADLFEMQTYLPVACLGDGSLIQLPNGLRIEVLEPLERLRLTFHDELRDTSVDVELVADGPPIGRGNALHFEQVMAVTGRLRLRGESYDVDCRHVRDRSWGEPRPETHNPGGPYTWVTGSTDDGELAFTVGAAGDPAGSTTTVRDSWVRIAGQQLRATGSALRVTRDPSTLRPTGLHLELVAEGSLVASAVGVVDASVPWSGWPNMVTHIGMVRWHIDSGAHPPSTAWGSSQEVQWNEFVRSGLSAVDPPRR